MPRFVLAAPALRSLRAWRVFLSLSFASVFALAARAGDRVEIVWPTPNTAWAQGRPLSEILQQAGSGDPESGGFGGVRSGGLHFHEGIDIKCLKRDRHGEPVDSIFAAMTGIVRHISTSAGDSSYGRYIVLEHPDQSPGIYTLYAHLSRIAPGLRVGDHVQAGQQIGIMGHSSGGYSIPRDRAHLHFEIGVMVTRDFQAWYDYKKFGSTNDHGLWNGNNLMGFDPLDFLNQWRAHRVNTFQEYFAQMEPAVRVKIATRRMPDYVLRYPALVTKPIPLNLAGWEIKFNWTGIPFAWTPLTPMETMGLVPDRPTLYDVNESLISRERSKSVAIQHRGIWFPGHDLEVVLQQLFGLR